MVKWPLPCNSFKGFPSLRFLKFRYENMLPRDWSEILFSNLQISNPYLSQLISLGNLTIIALGNFLNKGNQVIQILEKTSRVRFQERASLWLFSTSLLWAFIEILTHFQNYFFLLSIEIKLLIYNLFLEKWLFKGPL